MVDQHKPVANVAIRLKDTEGNILNEDEKTIDPGTYTVVGRIEKLEDLEPYGAFLGLIARWKVLGSDEQVLSSTPFPSPKLAGKVEGHIEGELGILTIDQSALALVLGGIIFHGRSMEGLQFLKLVGEERFQVVKD